MSHYGGYDTDPYDYGNNYEGYNNDYDYGYVRPVSSGGSIGLNSDYPLGGDISDVRKYYPDYNENYRIYTPEYETYDRPKFYGSTTHNDEYYWKDPGILERSYGKYQSNYNNRELPAFNGETTHKSTFVTHNVSRAGSPENKIEKTSEEKKKIPFYDETSHRATYTPKNVERPNKTRKSDTLWLSSVPFENTTTTKDVYKPKETEKPLRYTQRDNLKVGGEFLHRTSNQESYIPHKVERPTKRRRSAPSLFARDNFYQDTTNRVIYTPKNVAQCPAEKVIRARNGISSKLYGNSKNGHIYFPIKSTKTQENHTETHSQLQKNLERPLSDGQIQKLREIQRHQLEKLRISGQELGARQAFVKNDRNPDFHRTDINRTPIRRTRLDQRQNHRRISSIGIVPRQAKPMPRPEVSKPTNNLRRSHSNESIVLSEINYDKLL